MPALPPVLRSVPHLSLAALAALVGLQSWPVRAATPPQTLPIEAQWCLRPDVCLQLEVADEPHEQAMGLQLRPRLLPLHGMWFPYVPRALARFWMHRTPEPLDMLFVREDRVIAIVAAVPSCMRLPCRSYGPDELVDGVVELAAGQAEALGITVGSPVRIEPLPARPAAGTAVR